MAFSQCRRFYRNNLSTFQSRCKVCVHTTLSLPKPHLWDYILCMLLLYNQPIAKKNQVNGKKMKPRCFTSYSNSCIHQFQVIIVSQKCLEATILLKEEWLGTMHQRKPTIDDSNKILPKQASFHRGNECLCTFREQNLIPSFIWCIEDWVAFAENHILLQKLNFLTDCWYTGPSLVKLFI